MNVLHTHYKVATLTGQVLFVANGEKAREGYTGRSWTATSSVHGLTYFIHELMLIDGKTV